MRQKRKIVCVDCGAEFWSAAPNVERCEVCRVRHSRAVERERYHRNKVLISMGKKNRAGGSTSDVHFLDLPCPWESGRLPDSVTRNALWA